MIMDSVFVTRRFVTGLQVPKDTMKTQAQGQLRSQMGTDYSTMLATTRSTVSKEIKVVSFFYSSSIALHSGFLVE